jgi:hypothetical protein
MKRVTMEQVELLVDDDVEAVAFDKDGQIFGYTDRRGMEPDRLNGWFFSSSGRLIVEVVGWENTVTRVPDLGIRPSERGPWMWEGNDGSKRCIEFDDEMSGLINVLGCPEWVTPEYLEGADFFKRWLGPAVAKIEDRSG